MPKAGLVIVGNEILTGKVTDENTPWLARRCRELGVDLCRVSVIPDEVALIAEEVARCSSAFDHVFTTGGVGPTHDDVTMEGVAAAFGVPVVRHPDLERILRTRLGERCTEAALRMAEIPEGSELWWDGEVIWPQVVTRNVAVFPGVPSLLRRKFDAVAARFRGEPVHSLSLETLSRETDIAALLYEAAARWPQVAIGSYPHIDVEPHSVTVTLDSRDTSALQACYAMLQAGLAALG